MKILLIAAGCCAVFLLCGLQYGRVDVTICRVLSAKLKKEVKICVLADLHCRRFGKGQSSIRKAVEQEHPDLIVIPGDLFDVDRDFEISFELIEALKGYTVCFSSGNHDMYLKEIGELRQRLTAMGVHVLEDSSEIFECSGQKIRITGLSDHGRKPVYTPEEVKNMMAGNADYDVILYHRPDYRYYFRTLPADLVISGHAHGGQWCIPFTTKGLYAPQEGFLPKYTAGMYEDNGVTCVISRGLASGMPLIPRLYNNPEIVMIHIGGEE